MAWYTGGMTNFIEDLMQLAADGAESTYHAPDCQIALGYAEYERSGKVMAWGTPCTCIIAKLRARLQVLRERYVYYAPVS